MNRINGQPPGTTYTEIVDDGPRWRAIVIGAVFAAILLVILITAWSVIDGLELDRRAQAAIEENQVVSEAIRPQKVLAWQLGLLSLAGIAASAAATAWTFALGYAARTVQSLRHPEPRLLHHPIRSAFQAEPPASNTDGRQTLPTSDERRRLP